MQLFTEGVSKSCWSTSFYLVKYSSFSVKQPEAGKSDSLSVYQLFCLHNGKF